jgi:hypothetical protein
MLAAVLLGWVLSPTVIIPPREPMEPVSVYVLDRGYHSRLILPQEAEGFVLYAYGDWHYFALHQQDWSRGLAALLLPTQGALGRQVFKDFPTLAQSIQRQNILLEIGVARADVVRLRQALDNRFQRNYHTRVVNSRNQLTFVQDDQDYTLLHNSNHELVQWLQQLDCQVQGFVALPNFQLSQPDQARS